MLTTCCIFKTTLQLTSELFLFLLGLCESARIFLRRVDEIKLAFKRVRKQIAHHVGSVGVLGIFQRYPQKALYLPRWNIFITSRAHNTHTTYIHSLKEKKIKND